MTEKQPDPEATAALDAFYAYWRQNDEDGGKDVRIPAMRHALDVATAHRLAQLASGLAVDAAKIVEAIAALDAPREPTNEMLTAARDWSAKFVGHPIGNKAATGCWQAMFDAIPSRRAQSPSGLEIKEQQKDDKADLDEARKKIETLERERDKWEALAIERRHEIDHVAEHALCAETQLAIVTKERDGVWEQFGIAMKERGEAIRMQARMGTIADDERVRAESQLAAHDMEIRMLRRALYDAQNRLKGAGMLGSDEIWPITDHDK